MKVWQLILASHSVAKKDKSQMFYFTPTFSEKLELLKSVDHSAAADVCVHVCSRGNIASNGRRAQKEVPTLQRVLQAARKGIVA